MILSNCHHFVFVDMKGKSFAAIATGARREEKHNFSQKKRTTAGAVQTGNPARDCKLFFLSH